MELTVPAPFAPAGPGARRTCPDAPILSAGSRRVLAILNGHDPLLLPPGSVLRFDDPPGELVVTGIGVVGRRRRGIVCLEPEPEPGHRRVSAASGRPGERPGHLRPVPPQTPWWSTIRLGND